MEKICKVADKVTVLDHHASAQKELKGLANTYANTEIIFDMNRSGAMITWNYFYPDSKAPTLVELVQDRDLWLFNNQYTKALTAYMFTRDKLFHVWDTLNDEVTTGKAIDIGQVLLDAHNKDVTSIIEACTRKVLFNGHKVNLTNAHWMYASDIGNQTVEDNLFSITYFISKDGTYSYSLRAKNNFDCSILASSLGGGGHPNASGFNSSKQEWAEIL